jgi:hypothetical protein
LFFILFFYETYISPMFPKRVMDKSGMRATKTAIPISSASAFALSASAHFGQSGPTQGSGVCVGSGAGVGTCVSSIFLFFPPPRVDECLTSRDGPFLRVFNNY